MQTGYLSQLLGKRITGVVLKESDGTPRGQLFLIFDDGTHFEFYSSFDKVVPTKGLWPHPDGQTIENVRGYMGDTMRIVEEAYLEPSNDARNAPSLPSAPPTPGNGVRCSPAPSIEPDGA